MRAGRRVVLSEESRAELNWWAERTKDMAKVQKKKREQAMRVAVAQAEQLAAGAFRAALTDFLVEARKTLQVVKVAALTHAAVGFYKLSAHPLEKDQPASESVAVNEAQQNRAIAESDALIALAERCTAEAKTALGHVTG